MTINPVWDQAAVERAVSQVAASRPAYTSILGFYGPVFVAQIKAAESTLSEGIQIDESLVKMKTNEGFALIEPAAFAIDTPAAEKLLRHISGIAVRSGEKLSRAGEALIQAMDSGVAAAELLADVLDDQGRIAKFAKAMDVPSEMVVLLLYLSVKPSVEAGARQLAARLADSPRYRSSCPICGSAPIIGELDAEGNQWVHCGLCWHRWPGKRMACAFCSNPDSASLEYAYSDDEPEYRLNLCAGCRQYLKVVDLRKMDRHFYPPLEQVVSLHLDLLAAEKGFRHASGAISAVQQEI